MKTLLSKMSVREKNLWAELLVDVVVGLYYLPKMFVLLQGGERALTGGAMAGLVTSTVLVGIMAGVAAAVLLGLLSQDKDAEPLDERDHSFLARGNLVAYVTLVAGVVLIISQVVIFELMPELWQERGIPLSPVAIANLLLVALVLSSVVKVAAQLFSYRRGY